MNRREVLDRVGGLLLLPNTEPATMKQIAEFYGVDVEVIKSLIKRNRTELESNIKLKEYGLAIGNKSDYHYFFNNACKTMSTS